ncbi:MAG: Gfo/Idh/MocA family oxidoreductase [Akkermansiaceae bacterium]|jgi:predicted dehydrogenase|nr:Gfo/Idh/MocA family oxidoreductase [Akkermansiaceae bacterium]MCU0778825.1 Gfo/Idh/MocA family oxidoreductase [Akkermansiaceae bacterium]
MNTDPNNLSRRGFLSKSLAGAGAGLVLGAPNILRAANQSASGTDAIHVALVGFGKQAEVLFECLKNIPGLRIQAVCDISKNRIDKYRSASRGISFAEGASFHTDIDEMLAKEQGLDAAIVATPDFWHSPHTVKCLEAGLHVYCEKMMSNTIDGARDMVRAMEKTGKLCQIGHQRRSNPRYRFTYNRLINGNKICGQIVNANGQWNRSLGSSRDIGGAKIAKSIIVPDDILNQYGFKDMHQYLNWRVYRDLSGGPISDLGAHQIDIFNWFLGTPPKRVYASGGNSYFKNREHFDNVMCIFDYDTPQGEVRAFYQVLTTTSYGLGFYESFMGTEASIRISEIAATSAIYRESGDHVPDWGPLVDKGYLVRKPAPPKPEPSADAVASYESAAPDVYDLPGGFNKPAHQPHLENFFDAVRGKATLNCDARHAFESEAPIFWVNPSALTKQPIELKTEHLSV